MNFYKHHIGDFDQATRHLSFIEDAAYCRMIRKYYAEEKVLPVDVKKIERLIGARTKEEREAVAAVLEEFFVLEADGWHNKRCDEELSKANAQADANRKIALAREAKKRERVEHEQSTNRGPEESTNRGNEQHESWSASKHDSLPSREPSQTPDSRLQTPDLKAAHRGLDTPPSDETPDALPEIQSTLTPQQAATLPVVKALRAEQVPIMAVNPLVAEWIAKGLTEAKVPELIAFIRARGKTGSIHPNFINSLIDDALNPPKPKPKQDDWHRSDAGIARKAKELRITAGAGWSYDRLKEKVWDEIRRKERQGEAA